MAFSGAEGPRAQAGPDLHEFVTERLGFLPAAPKLAMGLPETTVRLLPSKWPDDNPPPPTCSLLSVASQKGLLAAAGPDVLVLATTESVRRAYHESANSQEKDKMLEPSATIRPFTPQATISLPVRLTHVAFSSDESCLVIAAEQGGGLAAYHVQSLLSGGKDSAFQIATSGTSVRALAPNPSAFPHIFAVVLADGKLLMADMQSRQLVSGNNGHIFKEGVSCASWSTKGKQIALGLADGTGCCLDPQGAIKALIPRPPQMTDALPVTSITWVANDVFLLMYTPPPGSEASDSQTYLATRVEKTSNFTFHKVGVEGDPLPAFGSRTPNTHYVVKLKDWPPALSDMLIFCSTASEDVALVTKATQPLTTQLDASKVTNVYTQTSLENRRAILPSTEDMEITSPIGVALDLSAKENAQAPFGNDPEFPETSTPLPALMILNTEGVLSTWWIMYDDSVRQKQAYPGLTYQKGAGAPAQTQAAITNPGAPAPPSSQLSAPSAGLQLGGGSLANPRTSPWSIGASNSQEPVKAQSTSLFGSLGSSISHSGSTPTNQATGLFGSAGPTASQPGNLPSALQPSASSGQSLFGGTSTLGAQSNVWGMKPLQPTQQAPTKIFGSSAGSSPGSFGKPSGAGVPGAASPATQSSPFARFATQDAGGVANPSPFARAFAQQGSGNAPGSGALAKFTPQNQGSVSGFGSFAQQGSGGASKPSPFASSAQQKPSTPGLLNTPSFGSTVSFPSNTTGSFGSSSTIGAGTTQFGGALAPKLDSIVPNSKEMDMDMGSGDSPSKTKTPDTAQETNLGLGMGGFKLGSSFKESAMPASITEEDSESPPKKDDNFFGSGFRNALGDSSAKNAESEPKIKQEPEAQKETHLMSVPPAVPDKSALGDASLQSAAGKPTQQTAKDDAPLPPDFTKLKPLKAPEDAPLPPDFTATKAKPAEEDLPPIAGSPPVDLGDDARFSEDERESEARLKAEAAEINRRLEDEEDESDWADESDDSERDEESGLSEEAQETAASSRAAAGAAAGRSLASRLDFPSPSNAKDSSTTPAGMPKAPHFPPPSAIQQSPRSPSPVRPSSTSLGQPRSSSSSRRMKKTTVPPAKPLPRPASATRKSDLESRSEQEVELTDDEGDRVRAELDSEIVPSKTLEPFVAHQDYIGVSAKKGISGQIECLYRDVNSMIDTLGLNARSLQAFIKGHSELNKDGEKVRSDLEDEAAWCLTEIEDLAILQRNALNLLEAGRIENPAAYCEELSIVKKEMTRLRTKTVEIRKEIRERTDPEAVGLQRAKPLDEEARQQQNELRAALGSFQGRLQEAEATLSLLRADLAASGVEGSPAKQAQPTFEAVTNTILKMTAMIEQKSGDVDVLESQIRRLPGGLASLSLGNANDFDEDELASAMGRSRITDRSTPLATPPASRRRLMGRNEETPLGMSGTFSSSRFRTPRRNPETGVGWSPEVSTRQQRNGNADGALRASLLGHGANGSAAKKKMRDVDKEEVARWHARRARRTEVLRCVKEGVEKRARAQTQTQT
ncbi:hypothetical protein LTR50_003799 [Elasticomyces elasticus]|nr:hypothetical protein LTR50_003799 [Elasticomyces elasticus]